MEIGPRVRGPAEDLLGREIERGADDLPPCREPLRARLFPEGDAEVENDGTTVGANEDVVGLEVPVHHAARVDASEDFQQRQRRSGQAMPRHAPARTGGGRDRSWKWAALDELHDQKWATILHAFVE
jgi:hypothetical protein